MIEVDSIRPSGVRRKIMTSPAIAVETAGNYIAGYFPHASKILSLWFVPTVAVGTAPDEIDIGVASAGETIIKDYSLSNVESTAGTAVDIGSGNLLTTEIPANTTIWINSSGASTGGAGHFVLEYEDNSN